jgi:NAD(P)-dependent dehydrogenase (short-subunit alcohol dehydrogenase family)
MASGRLANKVAVITGGAGSIGLASARAMVAEGAKVMLVDLDSSALASAAESIGTEPSVAWQVADVTDEAQVDGAVEATVSRFGGLDVAFANAGIYGAAAPITELPVEVFERVLSVNVVGSMLLAKHALAVMRPGGSLIINSSVVGVTSVPNIAAYATSKHALVGLARTAAKEMAPKGIRVNSLHPGPVDNDFQHRIEMQETGATLEESAQIFDSFIPLSRHADVDEIAAAVVFLASDDCRFMTGAQVVVDGGLSI